MYKLIDSSSFFPESEPSITVLHPENIKDLIKVAADSQIQQYISELKPESGKIYVHILAMGAGEFYGANKNGDFFPENNLLDYYKTFQTSPAHVFRHHVNKDPAKAIGRVLYAIYNPRMRRVELIAEIDKQLGEDIEKRISLGEFPSTSMACKTPFDICSICGNKAHSRQEYCIHLRTQLGQLLPDGRRAMAYNNGPLKFFDISIVVKPADVTSGILQKVAFAEPTGSAELAEIEDITDERIKEASFKKLSELIKRIEDGYVVRTSPQLSQILSRTQDPDYQLIDNLEHVPLEHAFRSMADLGILPSLSFLAELISRRLLGEIGKNMGSIIEELIHNIGINNLDIPKVEFEQEGEVSPFVYKAIQPYVEGSSLFPEHVEKRASGVGYANLSNGRIQLTEQELMQERPIIAPAQEQSIFHTLTSIGTIALLARWYISTLINQRAVSQRQQNNAKIVIIKKASDLETTHKLCQASMEQVIVVNQVKNPSKQDSPKSTTIAVFKGFMSKAPNTTIKKLSKIMKVVDLVGSLNQKEIKT